MTDYERNKIKEIIYGLSPEELDAFQELITQRRDEEEKRKE